MKTDKTNAMRLLDQMQIAYRVVSYSTDDGAVDGLSVAAKTGRSPRQVFKTLVTRGAGGGIFVFCLPVDAELNLKQAARAVGEKSVAMLPQADIVRATGYVRGGVSPVGMKKAYPTYIHASAEGLPSVLVSAGRVGLQVELAPADLCRAARAAYFAQGDGAAPHE